MVHTVGNGRDPLPHLRLAPVQHLLDGAVDAVAAVALEHLLQRLLAHVAGAPPGTGGRPPLSCAGARSAG